MAFDSTYPTINMSNNKEFKWKDFYGKLKESIPTNVPEERDKEVDLCGYVDINHTGGKKTRRSCSYFLIFLNTALLQ